MSINLSERYISPVYRNSERAVAECLESDLLSLAKSSDVNDPDEVQFSLAQQALRERTAALEAGWDGSSSGADTDTVQKYLSLCHQITINHLTMRKARFGSEQCAPFEELCNDSDSYRDIFLVIKFMDEEKHIASTIYSLLSQKGLDLNRVVIVGVDNMSSDKSSAIFKKIQSDNTTPIRMVYCQQETSGGGSAARLGVDRCIATVAENSGRTGDLSLLHRARISVSDGDTVYHPSLVADSTEIFDTHHHIDGVMPFLTYKLTACLRLFENYQQKEAAQLLAQVAGQTDRFVFSNIDLDTIHAMEEYPRGLRIVSGDGVILGDKAGNGLFVPYIDQTPDGIRYGVLIDRAGNRALIFEDRHLVVEKAPVSGYDNVLVHLENGKVRPSEVWRWHSLIGHDLFLLHVFRSYDDAREFILPDTSDALKGFRVWAFSVGGQHQLSRPNTPRVTGTDYQSGRVLQCFGARSCLGSAFAHSETEIDRLAKMVRNFSNEQGVFYGNVRSGALERASGLYLHMSRIQDKIEAEVRSYSEEFYRDIVFPERVLFPLRWMIQNFISALCVSPKEQRTDVGSATLERLFTPDVWSSIRDSHLSDDILDGLNAMSFEELRAEGEAIAETLISEYWHQMIEFYVRILRDFFSSEEISEQIYDPLLRPLKTCRNALVEERPDVNVNDVWSESEFVVDKERGQVLDMKSKMTADGNA